MIFIQVFANDCFCENVFSDDLPAPAPRQRHDFRLRREVAHEVGKVLRDEAELEPAPEPPSSATPTSAGSALLSANVHALRPSDS